MKYLLLITLVATSLSVTGQKLLEDKKDEFTGLQVKETSVEKLAHPLKMSGFAYNFAVRKVDAHYYFNLRMMSLNGEVFAIRKDSKFMLKLKNDSVITLLAPSFEVSGKGEAGSGLSAGNAQGVSIYYPITKDEISLIHASEIVKIRVYTSGGFTDQDIKEAGSKKIKAAFTLLQ